MTGSRKGLGTLLTILVAILIVVIAMFLLFNTQLSATEENVETLSRATSAQGNNMEVENLNDITMMVPGEQNVELVKVLMYGCTYGDPNDDYEYTVSPTDQIYFEAGNDVQEVLDETIPGQYYLRMQCSDDRVVTAGKQPPEDADVVGSAFTVPLPDGSKTTAYLYRWRE